MAFDAEWSEDFCLYCDGQITRGAYCSEACRQADRRSSTSAQQPTVSRTTSTAGSTASSWSAQARAAAAAGSLPSGYVFPKRSTTQGSVSSISSRQPSPGESIDPLKRFSVSSIESPSTESPSALSRSLNSTATRPALSEYAMKELRQYENSFDQSRQNRMRQYGSR